MKRSVSLGQDQKARRRVARRTVVLSGLSLAAAPAALGAETPWCGRAFIDIGNGWEAGSSVDRREPFALTRISVFRRPEEIAFLGRLADLAPETTNSSQGLRVGSTPEGFELAIGHPRGLPDPADPTLVDDVRGLLGGDDRSGTMGILIDIGDARFGPIERPLEPWTVLRMSGDELDLMVGREQVAITVLHDGEEAMRVAYDMSGLDDAIQRAIELAQTHRAEVIAAGECLARGGGGMPPCILTTAAVGILGKPDDCFELRQMRHLRDAFPGDADAVEAYVETGRRLLEGPQDRVLRFALVAFFHVVARPAAAFVAFGWMRMARAHYLAGFGALRHLCARRLAR